MDQLFDCVLNGGLGELEYFNCLSLEVPDNHRPEVLRIPSALAANVRIVRDDFPKLLCANRLTALLAIGRRGPILTRARTWDPMAKSHELVDVAARQHEICTVLRVKC